uniref:Uncharacterized protein n=1 Tax=Megaselia scalaris TaxID=36166 RepID=T1GF71_MEGSC
MTLFIIFEKLHGNDKELGIFIIRFAYIFVSDLLIYSSHQEFNTQFQMLEFMGNRNKTRKFYANIGKRSYERIEVCYQVETKAIPRHYDFDNNMKVDACLT